MDERASNVSMKRRAEDKRRHGFKRLSGVLEVLSEIQRHSSLPVIARRRSRRGNPVPCSDYRCATAACPSLRGGAADAAIQFHALTTGARHQPSEKQNLWIAASAAPPRNDGGWGMLARIWRRGQRHGPGELQPPCAFTLLSGSLKVSSRIQQCTGTWRRASALLRGACRECKPDARRVSPETRAIARSAASGAP